MTYPNDLPPSPHRADASTQGEAARSSAQVKCPSCGAFVPSTAQGWTRRMERCKGADGQEASTTRLVPYATCASCGRGPVLLD